LNRNVFIVHGRSHKDRDDLAEIVRELGCQPKVLADEPRNGGTIIEEFEELANTCVFAFVILTPDDVSADAMGDEDKHRARQNVIFEMGWFFARLGRSRTRLLYRDSIELPSDVTGVLYLKYKELVSEKKSAIRRSLVEGGLIPSD
jgi:predicted nucleotide-binding protein